MYSSSSSSSVRPALKGGGRGDLDHAFHLRLVVVAAAASSKTGFFVRDITYINGVIHERAPYHTYLHLLSQHSLTRDRLQPDLDCTNAVTYCFSRISHRHGIPLRSTLVAVIATTRSSVAQAFCSCRLVWRGHLHTSYTPEGCFMLALWVSQGLECRCQLSLFRTAACSHTTTQIDHI